MHDEFKAGVAQLVLKSAADEIEAPRSSTPFGQSDLSDPSVLSDPSDQPAPSDNQPTALIQQGVSFFSDLVKTLSNPEATTQLVDTLVSEDPATGKATLNIPVPDKHTVQQFLLLLGQLVKKQ